MQPYEKKPRRQKWVYYRKDIRGVKDPVHSMDVYRSECTRGNGGRRLINKKIIIEELNNIENESIY